MERSSFPIRCILQEPWGTNDLNEARPNNRAGRHATKTRAGKLGKRKRGQVRAEIHFRISCSVSFSRPTACLYCRLDSHSVAWERTRTCVPCYVRRTRESLDVPSKLSHFRVLAEGWANQLGVSSRHIGCRCETVRSVDSSFCICHYSFSAQSRLQVLVFETFVLAKSALYS